MEIEAKIRLKNPSKLRSRLQAIDSEFVGRWFERNWLFDHPEGTLTKQDKLLRVREARRTYLTFKGPRQETEFKEREELEIDFPESVSARALMESVGFVQWFYYEKVRETWKLGSCEIVVDELPELGIFVEIEGPSEEEIEEAIRKTKLPRRGMVESTYVELFEELSKTKGFHMREFKFPPKYKFVLDTDMKEA